MHCVGIRNKQFGSTKLTLALSLLVYIFGNSWKYLFWKHEVKNFFWLIIYCCTNHLLHIYTEIWLLYKNCIVSWLLNLKINHSNSNLHNIYLCINNTYEYHYVLYMYIISMYKWKKHGNFGNEKACLKCFYFECQQSGYIYCMFIELKVTMFSYCYFIFWGILGNGSIPHFSDFIAWWAEKILWI